MSTSFQSSGQLSKATTHDTMETGGQVVKTPPVTVGQSFGIMLPPGQILQQQQRLQTSQAYVENRGGVTYTPFTVAGQHVSNFEAHVRLAKDEKDGLTRALLDPAQSSGLTNAQFQKFQPAAFAQGSEGMNSLKGERSDLDEKGMSPLSMATVSFQDGGQPSPTSNSQTGTRALRFQASGNPGDAMLSAINYNDSDMLQDGGFDVSMPASLPNLEDGLLSNMTASGNVRLSENPGATTFDLFDGNVAEPYNMESLSPQPFHDANPSFNMADNSSLGTVGDGDSSGKLHA